MIFDLYQLLAHSCQQTCQGSKLDAVLSVHYWL